MSHENKSMECLLAEIEALEKKASMSEKFMNSITSSSTNAIITILEDGTIKSWNTAAENMFQYNSKEIINCNISKIIPNKYIVSKDEKPSKRLVSLWLRSKTGGSNELLGKKKSGEEFLVELLTSKWEADNTTYITGIISDISNRKKVFTEFHKLNQALKKSKEIVFMTDTQGVFTYVNEQFTKSYGYLPNEVIGIKTPRILKSPTSKIDYDAYWEKLLNKKSIVNNQYTNRSKNGAIIHIEGTVDSILSDSGELLGYLSLQRDIGERLVVLENLKEALAKAKESDRLKSEFLATMSHELRTPLNSIIGLSSLIDEDMSLSDIIEYNQIINTSGEHLLHIVENLFDVSLIQSGQLKPIKKNVKLKTFLVDIDQSMKIEQKKLNKGHINFNLLISPEHNDLILHTDEQKLSKILTNLLRNALVYTKEGYINFGYNVYQEEGETKVKFFIEDTGIGIDKNHYDIIFDLFRQVDSSFNRQYEGLGIGLTIAKQLTLLLGGDLWLESVKGEGTTFFFTLPLEEIKHSEVNKSQNKSQNTNVLKDKLVLIAEDDESNFEYLKTVLQLNGVKHLWAKNGKIAIKCVEENTNIDLILMDINMPVLNGFEAIKKIKKINPDIPIIAQTAYAFDDEKDKIIEVGSNDYISKPIKIDQLLAVIEKNLK